jgi:hypothetical protein
MKSIIKMLAKSETFANLIFSIVLFSTKMLFKLTAMRFQFFKNRLREKNLTVQIKLKDNSRGRYFIFRRGSIISKGGIHASPDVTLIFRNVNLALDILVPPRNYLVMLIFYSCKNNIH